MAKPTSPGKKKTFIAGRLLAKFRMAAKKRSGPKWKRRSSPQPKFTRKTRPRPKPTSGHRRYQRFKR